MECSEVFVGDRLSELKLSESEFFKTAKNVIKILNRHGHDGFIVGGSVRDIILLRKPQDFDIATSATPEEVIGIFRKTIPVGKKFGTVIVRMNGFSFEVTTFRKDYDYRDGRHPEIVEYGTIEDDVKRRDFTINGLYLDPFLEKVIDYVGGMEDIRKGVIRAIGDPDERFREDRLRILRAIRFAAEFLFEIEPSTWEAIRSHAKYIEIISKERIRDELIKMFTGSHPDRALELLDESGLLEIILPEVSKMKGVMQPPNFHPEGDVFTHTKLMLKMMKKKSVTLAFGVLLHDVGKPDTFEIKDRIRFNAHDVVGAKIARKILKRLKFSKKEIDLVSELVRNHIKFINVPKMRLNNLKKFVRMENFDEHLELHRLDCLGSHRDLSIYNFLKQKLDELTREEIKPKPLINGHDLINLGFKPGPVFKKILTAVEDEQLLGNLKTKEDAIKFVKERFIEGKERKFSERKKEDSMILLKNASQVLTMSSGSVGEGLVGVIKNGSVVIKNGKIEWVGRSENLPESYEKGEGRVIDCTGKVVMPSFIDCHTHTVYGGSRHIDFKRRAEGLSYEEILKLGGGIHTTVEATRKASKDELFETALERLKRFVKNGVTTVEIKSGYGLTFDDEIKMLEVIKSLKEKTVLSIKATFLGAHVVPKEFKNRRAEYVDMIVNRMLPYIKKRSLAEFVDVFCDDGAYTLKEAEIILKKAKELGFGIKIHSEQLTKTGASKMACNLNAVSCDHLEMLEEEDVEFFKKSGTVPVFLPGATVFIGKKQFAKGDIFTKNGIIPAISTDCNPGSSNTENILLMATLSCVYNKLTPEEVLYGITASAAKALSIKTKGKIEAGMDADINILDVSDYLLIPYEFGYNPVSLVIKGGKVIYEKCKDFLDIDA